MNSFMFIGLDNATVNYQQLGSMFFDHYRPAGQSQWVQDAVLWSQPSTVQTLAVKAFVLTRVGFFCGDQRMRHAGFESYGMALRAMQAALNNTDMLRTEETLVAAMCLCIYELYESTSGSETSWLKQAEGLSHLIVARGANAYDSHSLGMMLQGVRQVIQNLRKRRASIFNTAEWQSVPWLRRPKDAYDHLLDIGLSMGSWLAQIDVLCNFRHQTTKRNVREVLEACAKLEDALNCWRSDLSEAFTGTLYRSISKGEKRYDWTISNSSDWPAPYKFRSLELSRVLLFYWALRIVLSINTRSLCRVFDDLLMVELNNGSESHHRVMAPSDIAPLVQLIEMRKWRSYVGAAEALAVDIIRGVPYLADKDHGVWGSQNCLFPLSQARIGLQGSPDWRVDWCDQVLKLVQGRAGVVNPNMMSQIKPQG